MTDSVDAVKAAIAQIVEDSVVDVEDYLVGWAQGYIDGLLPGALVEVERPIEINDDGVALIKARVRPRYPLDWIVVSFTVVER